MKKTTEVGSQIRHGLVSAVLVFFQAFAADDGEVGGNAATQFLWTWRLLGDDLLEDLLRSVSIERPHQGQGFIKGGAKAKNISAVIEAHTLGHRLLRAHVERCAYELTSTTQRKIILHLGKTEIGDFGLIILADQNVPGFDITVNDPRLVRNFQGIAQSCKHFGDTAVPVDRQFVLLTLVGERVREAEPGGDEFLSDPVDAVFLTHAIGLHDAHVLQTSACLGLTLKSLQSSRAHAELWFEQLQRNAPLQTQLLRLPDCTHSSVAEFMDETVVTQDASGLWRRTLALEAILQHLVFLDQKAQVFAQRSRLLNQERVNIQGDIVLNAIQPLLKGLVEGRFMGKLSHCPSINSIEIP